MNLKIILRTVMELKVWRKIAVLPLLEEGKEMEETQRGVQLGH